MKLDEVRLRAAAVHPTVFNSFESIRAAGGDIGPGNRAVIDRRDLIIEIDRLHSLLRETLPYMDTVASRSGGRRPNEIAAGIRVALERQAKDPRIELLDVVIEMIGWTNPMYTDARFGEGVKALRAMLLDEVAGLKGAL